MSALSSGISRRNNALGQQEGMQDMKARTYESIRLMNEGFEQTLRSLKELGQRLGHADRIFMGLDGAYIIFAVVTAIWNWPSLA
jgi:hypothetical protein